ncbi:MAG: hypothetical protein ACOWWO_13545 [Peptococcaceae bacterium]
MTDNLRQEQQVQPGPCPLDPETGIPVCPPPTEIDIIKVNKVFNECMHTQVVEGVITGWTTANTTDATEASCDSVSVSNVTCTVLNGNDIVRVTFELQVCATVPLDTGGVQRLCATETVTRTLAIERASEEGLNVQCHIFPECLFCYISERDSATGGVEAVTCCVGVLILLKVDAEVQLLIPTYGYPGPPPECEEFLGECPTDFNPDWPPYPPQLLFGTSAAKKGNGTYVRAQKKGCKK